MKLPKAKINAAKRLLKELREEDDKVLPGRPITKRAQEIENILRNDLYIMNADGSFKTDIPQEITEYSLKLWD